MHLGHDYPRYRYPSYAPWCTPAGVAVEVQYIPQPREVPQIEKPFTLVLCRAPRERFRWQSPPPSHWFRSPGEHPGYFFLCLARACRLSRSRSRQLQRSTRYALGLPSRVFACRVTRYRLFVAVLSACMFRTSRPIVTLVHLIVATSSRYPLPGPVYFRSELRIDRPTSGDRPLPAARVTRLAARTTRSAQRFALHREFCPNSTRIGNNLEE